MLADEPPTAERADKRAGFALWMGDKMRLATLLAPCLGLALLTTTACDPFLEKQYFREGIGTELNRADLANATSLLNQYVGYVCKQAGLELLPDEPAANCSDRGFTPEQWVQFVKAGMNDIDVRCDSYLAWLDNRRRSVDPILRQISDMGKATGAILDVTGVSLHPITVVGQAFGLAANTFTNVNSRLLLEVNQSTVQSVVHRSQQDFRNSKKYTDTDNRSDAIHYLRSYLRLCMPFTIETEINTTVSIVNRIGPESLVNRPFIEPETHDPDMSESSGGLPAAAGTAAPKANGTTKSAQAPKEPKKARDTITPPADTRLPPKNAYNPILEGNPSDYTNEAVEKALKALCVRPDELAAVTEKTATLIKVFEQEYHRDANERKGKLDLSEVGELNKIGACPVAAYRNYYERAQYQLDPKTAAKALDTLRKALRADERGAKLPINANLHGMRETIKNVKIGIGYKESVPNLSDQVTPEFLTCLQGSVRPCPQ